MHARGGSIRARTRIREHRGEFYLKQTGYLFRLQYRLVRVHASGSGCARSFLEARGYATGRKVLWNFYCIQLPESSLQS